MMDRGGRESERERESESATEVRARRGKRILLRERKGESGEGGREGSPREGQRRQGDQVRGLTRVAVIGPCSSRSNRQMCHRCLAVDVGGPFASSCATVAASEPCVLTLPP